MKRLLIVLFGVLVFQGSVWADSCLKNWPPDAASVTKAKILYPVTEGEIIVKKSPVGVMWHETGSVGDWLGAHVNIRLYEQGKEQDLFKNRLLNKPNTGFFLISKKDFRTAGVKPGKQYYFAVEKVATDTAPQKIQIQSGCFTFDIKAKEVLQCNAATNMKECLKVLIGQNRNLLERMGKLEDTVKALEGGGGTVINQNTGHEHPEYAAGSHGHNFDSSSHSHENYAEAINSSAERHVSMTAATTSLESQVSALQAQLDALEEVAGNDVASNSWFVITNQLMAWVGGPTLWVPGTPWSERTNHVSLDWRSGRRNACWCAGGVGEVGEYVFSGEPAEYCNAKGWVVGTNAFAPDAKPQEVFNALADRGLDMGRNGTLEIEQKDKVGSVIYADVFGADLLLCR